MPVRLINEVRILNVLNRTREGNLKRVLISNLQGHPIDRILQANLVDGVTVLICGAFHRKVNLVTNYLAFFRVRVVIVQLHGQQRRAVISRFQRHLIEVHSFQSLNDIAIRAILVCGTSLLNEGFDIGNSRIGP